MKGKKIILLYIESSLQEKLCVPVISQHFAWLESVSDINKASSDIWYRRGKYFLHF